MFDIAYFEGNIFKRRMICYSDAGYEVGFPVKIALAKSPGAHANISHDHASYPRSLYV